MAHEFDPSIFRDTTCNPGKRVHVKSGRRRSKITKTKGKYAKHYYSFIGSGHILIADENNVRANEVTRADHIVRVFTAMGNNIGYDLHTTQNGLYAPYDAKNVGDYTGLTPPFDFDGDADDQF